MTTWRDWSDDLTARVARAVKSRRTALGLTAAELAARTDVGKPLTRAVISDLETGRKKSLEVSELLTLAAALDIPPILLLFPDYPDGTVEVVPGAERKGLDSAGWVSGRYSGPESGAQANPGVLLVQAAGEHLRLRTDLVLARARKITDDDTTPELADEIARLSNDVAIAAEKVRVAKSETWERDA